MNLMSQKLYPCGTRAPVAFWILGGVFVKPRYE